MSEFHTFAIAVNKRLAEMSGHELFVVDAVDIYAAYLSAFPDGTNPVFRVNTEHDCSCCRNFIRNMGGLVAIVNGQKQSIWAIEGLPYPYDVVAKVLDDLVAQAPISGVYRTKEIKYGAEKTREMMDSGVHTWNHFFGTVARRHHSAVPDTDRGSLNTTAQVLKRGLDELKPEALETVLDLIRSNALYRGAEFEQSVQEFQALQREYHKASRDELLVWTSLGSHAARFRNTVIGTLVQDLSDGEDLERAVRSFEAKVAPTNYKRPTALITPKMVDAAIKTLADLGLELSIERRFARIGDVSVNDVLFVDNNVRDLMKDGGLRSALLEAVVPRTPQEKDATPITMDNFIRTVLPTASRLEVLVRNRHLGNFVSLTAPVHSDTGRLFKWKNDFAWSYDGEVTDSIKQRVKKAGGNTNADLRVSLSWSNFDDLDLHAHCPQGHIFFGNKTGILDVDMNAGGGSTREPVENLSWVEPKDGIYRILVNQYCKRETDKVGFVLEIECNGQLMQFSHPMAVPNQRTVECFTFRMTQGVMSELKVLSGDLAGGDMSETKWGIKSEGYAHVATLMTSPNHWEGAGEVGNKHWIFMLKDCKTPEPARGIYNEFLRGDLEQHRKVFEVLGSKTKCQPTEDQLSGIGFSAGRNDKVTVKVTGLSSSRLYEINF